MNKEQIIKALECCSTADHDSCKKCPIENGIKDECQCFTYLALNALALINQLTVELDGKKAYMREYNRNHTRERYARLKAEGRCTLCGEPLTDKDTTLNCAFCRAKKKLSNKQQREKRRACR